MRRSILGAVLCAALAMLAAATDCGNQPQRPAAATSADASETQVLPAVDPSALRPVGAFASIDDDAARSKALFVEAGRVLQHPRCLNCHPSDAHPRQGESLEFHQPPVIGGEDGRGSPAMRCDTCHQQGNVDHAGIPGDPAWHLAPLEMGWIGVPLQEICEQIKDSERNGGLDLDGLHRHMAEDSLVGWGWNPGSGREPAPGTQAAFGELIRAWIDSGAHCPDDPEGAKVVDSSIPADCSSCHDRDYTLAAK